MSTILITGASRGIGQALALGYAAPGARLVLIARSQPALEEVAAECRRRGAAVMCAAIDVRDRRAMATLIAATDLHTPIDIVIANAGVTSGTPPGGVLEPPDDSLRTIEVNITGVLNTLHPLLPGMVARGRGQIGIVGSLAGLIPLPDSPSYCATKAAVLAYGQALRGRLAGHGIGVSVVCAGYVSTAMAARVSGSKPGALSAEQAARIIAAGLARNRAIIVFPRWLALLARLGAALPERLRRALVGRFSTTPSEPAP